MFGPRTGWGVSFRPRHPKQRPVTRPPRGNYQAEWMPSDLISEERMMAAYQALRREINLEGEKKRKKRKVK
jgi:hypothetical protein